MFSRIIMHCEYSPFVSYMTRFSQFVVSQVFSDIIQLRKKTCGIAIRPYIRNCIQSSVEGQSRSTEGCSKLKRSEDMTSSGKNGLNIITNDIPLSEELR